MRVLHLETDADYWKPNLLAPGKVIVTSKMLLSAVFLIDIIENSDAFLWFGIGPGDVGQRVKNWTNFDLDLRRHIAILGLKEL